MRSLVYLEVLAACKHFAATGMRAGKRFFTRVHAYMIDQLVFGFEGATVARTTEPVAGMRCALGSADMLHR